MPKKYTSKLTPLEKAEKKAYNFAFKMYESLLISAYMTSGSLDDPEEHAVVGNTPSSGSFSSPEHQAA